MRWLFGFQGPVPFSALSFNVIFSAFSGKSKFEQSYDSSEPHSNFRRSSDMNRQRTIESMIVVEKVMTKFYGVEQIKRYVPTIVNVVREIEIISSSCYNKVRKRFSVVEVVQVSQPQSQNGKC